MSASPFILVFLQLKTALRPDFSVSDELQLSRLNSYMTLLGDAYRY
ncbi:hypothetical protein VIC_003729 [Vibrio coralliilyticus ATCC BAA-450]|nr:hypothetical protein VIC_003729 [Vibrio coralliilyticus ATCC BAA-450]